LKRLQPKDRELKQLQQLKRRELMRWEPKQLEPMQQGQIQLELKQLSPMQWEPKHR
jgi:hypothetical protein